MGTCGNKPGPSVVGHLPPELPSAHATYLDTLGWMEIDYTIPPASDTIRSPGVWLGSDDTVREHAICGI